MTAVDFERAFADLEAIYRDLDVDVKATAVRCDLRGLCCDFERAGHVLYATDLEVAYAKAHGAAHPPHAKPTACPFFVGGQCRLRDGRPLGCRVYFCDPAYADAMHELAERYHRRVVLLHEAHGLSYRYAPFVTSVREESKA